MITTMNTNESISEEFYIFVNELLPMTFHNFNLTGCFTSGAIVSTTFSEELKEKYLEGTLKYLPYNPCEIDAMALSPYFITAINDYRVEYDAERFREINHSKYPSRLSAIYAFKDFTDCEKAHELYNWDLNTVKKFRLKEHPLNRVIKVNMEIVSLARHAYKVSSLENAVTDFIWQTYWTGQRNIELELPQPGYARGTTSSDIIWEYLIEGKVMVI